MLRRMLDAVTHVSLAACLVTLACWFAAVAGWKTQRWELSLSAVQDNVPVTPTWGVATEGTWQGLGEAGVRVQRYQPLSHPVDELPGEYRSDLFPFTAWTLGLTRISGKYGFSEESIPIFDRSAGHPRLMGTYQEWSIPYWLLTLAAGLLPGARWIRQSLKGRGRSSTMLR